MLIFLLPGGPWRRAAGAAAPSRRAPPVTGVTRHGWESNLAEARPRHSRGISEAAGDPRRPPKEETSGKKTDGDTFQEARRYSWAVPPSPAAPAPPAPPDPDLALRPPEPQVGVHGAAAPEGRHRGTVQQLHAPPGHGAAAPGSLPRGRAGAQGRLPAPRRGLSPEASRPCPEEGGGRQLSAGPGPGGGGGLRPSARQHPQGSRERPDRLFPFPQFSPA